MQLQRADGVAAAGYRPFAPPFSSVRPPSPPKGVQLPLRIDPAGHPYDATTMSDVTTMSRMSVLRGTELSISRVSIRQARPNVRVGNAGSGSAAAHGYDDVEKVLRASAHRNAYRTAPQVPPVSQILLRTPQQLQPKFSMRPTLA